MEFQEIIIAGIIIIVAALVVGFIFAPASEAHDTNIQILNKGDFGSNSTIYIKLTDNEKTSLSDKTVHIKIIDKNGTAVYEKDAKTHATGVAIAKLSNVSAGNYTLSVTFDGDNNYSSCSVEKQITIKGGEVVDVIDNSTVLDAATIQDLSSQTSSQPTYTSSSSSSPSDSSSSSDSSPSESSDSEYEVYIDENGNEMEPIIDENGKQVDPTTVTD